MKLNVEKSTLTEQYQIDGIAADNDDIEIEIQNELGFKDKYKLYIHVNGITLIRICKISTLEINRRTR